MKPITDLIRLTHTHLRLRQFLFAGLIGVVVGSGSYLLGIGSTTSVGLGVGVLLVTMGWFVRQWPSLSIEVIRYLHEAVPETEYSLQLLTQPEHNIAEALQVHRIRSREYALPSFWEHYRGLWPLLVLAGLMLALSFGKEHLRAFFLQNKTEKAQSAGSTDLPESTAPALPPSMSKGEVRLSPPPYTRQPEIVSQDLNIKALVNSTLTWQVTLDHADRLSLYMLLPSGEKKPFAKTGATFAYQDKLLGSGMYQLVGYQADTVAFRSAWYRAEAVQDSPPVIQPRSKELYVFHTYRSPAIRSISAQISDDFQVMQVYLVATVAKGSGENIKFREVKIPLSTTPFTKKTLSYGLNLTQLQLSPGDELYYYWAALDNRQPEPNFTKSDTYFIVYQDTTKADAAQLATMAVNVVPEFFRSQRQIIIDTEKLLANQKKMSVKQFNFTSDDLGHEQKILRLRYGQYLGEEYETNIGASGNPNDDEDGDFFGKFVHKHDTEEESHDHGHAPGHAHDHGEGASSTSSTDPLAALMEQYVHAHDNGEMNTFYEESTRSLLKMALDQMWQSELHLRLYEPKKALPYQYKALDFLKRAQHKARTFAKKSGFDPPPIKEKEMRLTGDTKRIVEDVFGYSRTYSAEQVSRWAASYLGWMNATALSQEAKSSRSQVGSNLMAYLSAQSLQNWKLIGYIQRLNQDESLGTRERNELTSALLALSVPPTGASTARVVQPKLEKAFRESLLHSRQ